MSIPKGCRLARSGTCVSQLPQATSLCRQEASVQFPPPGLECRAKTESVLLGPWEQGWEQVPGLPPPRVHRGQRLVAEGERENPDLREWGTWRGG